MRKMMTTAIGCIAILTSGTALAQVGRPDHQVGVHRVERLDHARGREGPLDLSANAGFHHVTNDQNRPGVTGSGRQFLWMTTVMSHSVVTTSN